ncbi:MAG: sensor histidine kinase [Acidimicrobiia bacterium]
MKTVAWGLVIALVSGLLIAELAMNLTPNDRPELYVVFGAAALLSFAGAATALRIGGHLRSLRTSLQVVALAAVAVTGLVVGLAALTMFIEPHDLTLLLVALVLGVGLGGVVAMAVAKPLTEHLAAVSGAASRVAAGDLSARTGVDRSDELGEVARSFDQMAARLESSDEERRLLTASISHDLRTPLASMQAAVEALQDGLAPDPPGYLRGLSHDIDYLRRLVDDLFLMSRIDAGSYHLEMSEIDLAELADEAVEAVAPTAARRRVSLDVATPGRVGIAADPAALGRVFRNLLANAVRHSPEGGWVRIELSKSADQVSALVTDEGAGFSPEVRARAFERLVRADDSRNRDTGGSGLGLAIARGIVEAHGGTIEILDDEGGQVRFTIPVRLMR